MTTDIVSNLKVENQNLAEKVLSTHLGNFEKTLKPELDPTKRATKYICIRAIILFEEDDKFGNTMRLFTVEKTVLESMKGHDLKNKYNTSIKSVCSSAEGSPHNITW